MLFELTDLRWQRIERALTRHLVLARSPQHREGFVPGDQIGRRRNDHGRRGMAWQLGFRWGGRVDRQRSR